MRKATKLYALLGVLLVVCIAAFAVSRYEEKKEQINALYLECLGDMQAELPLNKIYNSKWENATTNPTQIRREMMERKETVKQGLDAIWQMHSDAEEKAVAMFLESYDLTKSILYINQYEPDAAVEQAKEEAAQEVIDSMIPQDLEGSSNLYEYRMALTAEAKEKLEMYLTSVGIDWELI